MRLNVFAFGATAALSFFQLATASSSTAMTDNTGMTSVNGKLSSPNAGSLVKRDALLEGLLDEVKDIIASLKLGGLPILDSDLLNLNEDNIIAELLGLLGLSGGNDGSSNGGLGLGNTNGDKDSKKLITKFMGDGDDDEGDYDSREDDVDDIFISTQKLLCNQGISIEFYDRNNRLSSNSGSCIKSDKPDINLIESVVKLLGDLLLNNGVGLGKGGTGPLGKVIFSVTKLVHCLLDNLIGGIGKGNIVGVKRQLLRRALVQAVNARRVMN